MPKKAEFQPSQTGTARAINALCSRLDMTRPELAQALGVSETAIFKWLNGTRELKAPYKARIEAALKSLEEGHGPAAVRQFCLRGPVSIGTIAAYLEGR